VKSINGVATKHVAVNSLAHRRKVSGLCLDYLRLAVGGIALDTNNFSGRGKRGVNWLGQSNDAAPHPKRLSYFLSQCMSVTARDQSSSDRTSLSCFAQTRVAAAAHAGHGLYGDTE
jgi:hypothetical protein